MSKFSDYTRVTSADNDDLILISNASDGTRTITPENLFKAMKTIAPESAELTTNLNSATKIGGKYYFQGNTTNAPFTGWGFCEVLNVFGDYVVQMVHPLNSSTAVPYMRNVSQSNGSYAFGAWEKLAVDLTSATLITDLNNATKIGGRYYFQGSTPNAPFASWGFCEVLNVLGSYIVQMVHPLNSATAVPYMRNVSQSGSSYVFGAWEKLAVEGQDAKPIGNLNDATTVGEKVYFSTAGSNIPFNDTWGFCEVLNGYGNNIIQMAHRLGATTAIPYVRAGRDNNGSIAWSDWQMLAVNSDITDIRTKIGKLRAGRGEGNLTSFTFSFPRTVTGYLSFLLYGGTDVSNPFFYMGFIDAQNNVTFTKILDTAEEHSLTGSYNDSVLVINASFTVYGGINVIWNN